LSFLLITHVKHKLHHGRYYAYGPYVREMNLWFKHVKQVTVIAPMDKSVSPDAIDLAYEHPTIRFVTVPEFHFTSLAGMINSCIAVPYILYVIWCTMWRASHIHLRCPGNMGLLGCLVQILFPWKKKTAKYAGNWDPKSKQPLSYRMQKYILRNTFLTKSMQTLVYGDWPDRTKNILPFFTASYTESDKVAVPKKTMHDDVIRFLFVGTLTANKQPMMALKVFHSLIKTNNRSMEMHFYGEGPERVELSKYIIANVLQNCVFLHGNVNSEHLKNAYRHSHFLLFFSKSEGWPKAVSEAMWWGCVPVTSPVSCVRWMLNNGKGGVLIESLELCVQKVTAILNQSPYLYADMQRTGMEWSRTYTVEEFERSIINLC
jgi:glycosyltransferase involved in cell wall biosynthesis